MLQRFEFTKVCMGKTSKSILAQNESLGRLCSVLYHFTANLITTSLSGLICMTQ